MHGSSVQDWSALLEPMLRARRFDETLIRHAELITGVYHVSIGLEASAAGLALARRPGDLFMLNHRNHGHLAALGSDLENMYREIFGRDGGPQRGRAGTLHLADPPLGVPYTSAMVGGGVSLALGLALARKRTARPGIVFTAFGDGAMGEGALHEALNVASLWQLPLVFVCESNSPRDGERVNSLQAAVSMAALAEAHRVAAATVDAGRAREVPSAIEAAADAVRSGAGPRFVEVRSEPWPGNRGFLPSAEPPLELTQAALASGDEGFAAVDPVLAEVRALLDQGVPLKRIAELDGRIRAGVDAAARSARAAPLAPAAVACADVWATA
jgi:TPP-dependent pyruvate/acetoin dehydrogenase alpha subunit